MKSLLKQHPNLTVALCFGVGFVAVVGLLYPISVVDAAVLRPVATIIDGCADCRLPVMQLALWSGFKGALCGACLMLVLSFTPPDASGTAAGRTPAASKGEQQ